MPRRGKPDHLAAQVGARIRALREEQGMTMDEFVLAHGVRSKGYLSDIETGLALPSLHILQEIAHVLEVQVLDLLTFPDVDDYQHLVDRVRQLSGAQRSRLLKELPQARTSARAPKT